MSKLMSNRSVSFVDKIEFDFQGTIHRNAIAFGDVDNDGGNELVVCSTSGQLFVYKGRSSKPWRVCTEGLGCVTTVLVCDVTNIHTQCVLCLNTDGCCFVFYPSAFQEKGRGRQHEKANSSKIEKPVSVKDAKSSPVHSGSILIKPSFMQEMPANPKMATVCDIDGDGQMELIVAYSDRYVRVFKFKHILHERKHSNLLLERKQSKDEFQDLNKKSESKLSKQPSKDEEGKPMLSKLGKQPSKDSESNRSPSPMSPINSNKEQRFTYDSSTSGSFEKVDEYYLPGQVGSVAVVKCGESKTKLVASQPGGGYVILGEYNTGCPKDSQLLHANSLKAKGKPSEPEQLHVLYTNQGYPGRNFNVNCEVTGSIKRENQVSGLFGLFTVDGFFALVDASSEYNHLLPAVKITEHQWFHMSTLEFMEGNDDVILCSWEGVTYIINKDFEVACYDYGCNICGFDAGFYATDSQKNSPCFCYVTYSNKVVLYYNIDSIYQKSERLDEVLLEKLTGRPELNGILTTLVDEKGKIDNTKLMKLLQSTSRDST